VPCGGGSSDGHFGSAIGDVLESGVNWKGKKINRTGAGELGGTILLGIMTVIAIMLRELDLSPERLAIARGPSNGIRDSACSFRIRESGLRVTGCDDEGPRS
jgi:hypothetical protein